MKNILLTVLTLFYACLVAMSQAPTITSTHFLDPGTSFVVHYDTSAVPFASAGPNQTWNYSSMKGLFSDTTNVLSPVGTPGFAQYSGSTAAVYTKYDNTFSYFTATPQAISSNNYTTSLTFSKQKNGMDVEYNFEIAYSPLLVQIYVPFTYQSTYNGAATGKQTLVGQAVYDSIRYSQQISYAMLGDAWGSLQTPAGYFQNTLRIRNIQTTRELFETLSNNKWSTLQDRTVVDTSYAWFSPNVNYILFEMHKGQGGYFAAYYDVPTSTGLASEDLQLDRLKTYPNPAKDEFFVEGADEILQLSSASGQESNFRSAKVENGIMVNVQEAKAGIYFLKIRKGDSTRSIKIMMTE